MKRPNRKDYIQKASIIQLLADLEMYIDYLEAQNQALTISAVSDTLILTPKDAEIFFNEIMNHKEANDALKKAMLKFITR